MSGDTLRDVYLLLGSNMGERLKHLHTAVEKLAERDLQIISASNVYETEAWGEACQGQDAYLNAALHIKTGLDPHQLLETVLQVESEMGRVRQKKWEPRIIDIDILVYSDLIIDTPSLVIPHPYLPERRFALLPLTEIFDGNVAGTGRTAKEMLDFCPDSAHIRLLASVSIINKKTG